MSGARVETLKSELQKPEYHGIRADRIVLMTDTVNLMDAKDKPETIPDIIDKYFSLIDEAKAIAHHVTVSSVCPRLDDVRQLVEPFNTHLQVLCEDKECDFVDHNPNFTLGDGSTNDGYLTKTGLNKVAKNLKLAMKSGNTDVTRSYPARKSTPDFHQSDGNRTSYHDHKPSHEKRGTAKGDAPPKDWYPNVVFNRDGCVLCNEGGHSSSECHHQHTGPVFCHHCQAPGHKAKHHMY